MRRVRKISIDCLIENVTLQRNKQDCEINKKEVSTNYSIPDVIDYESESQGFKVDGLDVIREKLDEINDVYEYLQNSIWELLIGLTIFLT